MINIHKSKGVGLIEVLVTVLILATSLLAIAALQTRSLQFNQSAYFRSQANILAYDIIDRMRVNREAVSDYTLSYGGVAPTGSELADVDISEWLTKIEAILPLGEAEIDCNQLANPVVTMCTVSLRWTEKALFGEVDEDDLDAEARTTFSYSTSL